MPNVIHWFRRDLRVTDNTSLLAAAESASAGGWVLPVYVLSDWKGAHAWTGPVRQHFLCGCLASLAGNLAALGGRLVLRSGDACEALRVLLDESGADEIHTNADPDPFGKNMEKRIAAMAVAAGRKLIVHADVTLHGANDVLTQTGGTYRVFTPYSKTWFALPKPEPKGRPPRIITPPVEKIASLALPDLTWWNLTLPPGAEGVEPGEKAARTRLRSFLEDGIVSRYGAERDIPHGRTTSRLSQDLRFGTLSIREIYHRVEAAKNDPAAGATARQSMGKYQAELAWREFYMQILHHFPEVLKMEFNPSHRRLVWRGADAHGWEAWRAGLTGFPIVDAAMRQLNTTGFMHNRLRMVAAMFLTKDLHIDWRLGEMDFAQKLTDGEIASNNGGWQWSAGCGADAAPYFRIQNPWTQSARFDPQGLFIKKYVPELAKVPPALLHEPPRTPGLSLVPGYPRPIVDHATERDVTLAMFKEGLER